MGSEMFDHHGVSPSEQLIVSFMFCHGTQSMHIPFTTGFISPSGVARTQLMPGHNVSTPCSSMQNAEESRGVWGHASPEHFGASYVDSEAILSP